MEQEQRPDSFYYGWEENLERSAAADALGLLGQRAVLLQKDDGYGLRFAAEAIDLLLAAANDPRVPRWNTRPTKEPYRKVGQGEFLIRKEAVYGLLLLLSAAANAPKDPAMIVGRLLELRPQLIPALARLVEDEDRYVIAYAQEGLCALALRSPEALRVLLETLVPNAALPEDQAMLEALIEGADLAGHACLRRGAEQDEGFGAEWASPAPSAAVLRGLLERQKCPRTDSSSPF